MLLAYKNVGEIYRKLKSESTVEIIESYKDYSPPINALAVTQVLLRYVPEKCVRGLNAVVLTNASKFSRKRRRGTTKSRKRKVRVREAGGVYHPKTKTERAWIEIFVDNFTVYESRFIRLVPFFRATAFADVLYHEIGHHIHYTVRPEHREREDVADYWGARLTAHFIRQR